MPPPTSYSKQVWAGVFLIVTKKVLAMTDGKLCQGQALVLPFLCIFHFLSQITPKLFWKRDVLTYSPSQSLKRDSLHIAGQGLQLTCGRVCADLDRTVSLIFMSFPLFG
jgi:hypothetical protein